MRLVTVIILIVSLLSGCSVGNDEMHKAIKLREALLKGNGCTFTSKITADYGEYTFTFMMNVEADNKGGVTFSVLEPSSISGITGKIAENTGYLTFDEHALMFEMLADDQITPVSAPWLLIHTLRSGYISACGKDGEGMHIQIDDSYCAEPLQTDLWTDSNNIPVRAEFIWKGKRILSIDVADFVIV